MATISNVQAAANPALQAVNERGWRRGLANLLRNENSMWWGTRKWLVHLLLWLVVLNGLSPAGDATGPARWAPDTNCGITQGKHCRSHRTRPPERAMVSSPT